MPGSSPSSAQNVSILNSSETAQANPSDLLKRFEDKFPATTFTRSQSDLTPCINDDFNLASFAKAAESLSNDDDVMKNTEEKQPGTAQKGVSIQQTGLPIAHQVTLSRTTSFDDILCPPTPIHRTAKTALLPSSIPLSSVKRNAFTAGFTNTPGQPLLKRRFDILAATSSSTAPKSVDFKNSDTKPTTDEPSQNLLPQQNLESEGSEKLGIHSNDHAVKVFLRCRPREPGHRCVEILNGNEVQFSQNVKSVAGDVTDIKQQTYKMTSVFGEESTQETVFETVAVPLLDRMFKKSSNELIIAYGPSGSGKTYTTGPNGILGMAIDHIMDEIGGQQCKENIKPWRWDEIVSTQDSEKSVGSDVTQTGYSAWISFVEIYDDKCYDLFDRMEKKEQAVARKPKMDANQNPYIPELREHQIENYESAIALVHRVMAHRATESTKVNQKSSRSFLISTIKIVKITDGRQVSTARLAIADLAGSENSKHTEAAGVIFKQARKINETLLHLSKCINSMMEIQKAANSNQSNPTTNVRIPFRNSMLTTLLKSYFCGGQVYFTHETDNKFISAESEQLEHIRLLQELKSFKDRDGRRQRENELLKLRIAELERANQRVVEEKDEIRALYKGAIEERMREESRHGEEYVKICQEFNHLLVDSVARAEREAEEMIAKKMELFNGVSEMQSELDAKDAEIERLTIALDNKEDEVAELEDALQAATTSSDEKDEMIIRLKAQIPNKIYSDQTEDLRSEATNKDTQTNALPELESAESQTQIVTAQREVQTDSMESLGSPMQVDFPNSEMQTDAVTHQDQQTQTDEVTKTVPIGIKTEKQSAGSQETQTEKFEKPLNLKPRAVCVDQQTQTMEIPTSTSTPQKPDKAKIEINKERKSRSSTTSEGESSGSNFEINIPADPTNYSDPLEDDIFEAPAMKLSSKRSAADPPRPLRESRRLKSLLENDPQAAPSYTYTTPEEPEPTPIEEKKEESVKKKRKLRIQKSVKPDEDSPMKPAPSTRRKKNTL
ncbi:hypothetical protein HDU76_010229 [Blyttiomyces sp. JEL0837]|nr:hypothetical protein HDU76_010229 [Blyttiomyces sp. JEL0837]